MPLSNTSTTKLDNFDGNRRSARRRWLKLADESAGNSLPTFHQVCNASRDPTRSSSFFTRIRCAFTHMRVYRNFLPPQNSWARYYTPAGKHRHDSRICAQACVLLPPPANKYADVSATAFYSAVKMIKKGIDCPTTLKCWNTYGKAPPPTTPAFCLESMRILHSLFLAIVAIAFEDPAVLVFVPQTHFLSVSSDSCR